MANEVEREVIHVVPTQCRKCGSTERENLRGKVKLQRGHFQHPQLKTWFAVREIRRAVCADCGQVRWQHHYSQLSEM